MSLTIACVSAFSVAMLTLAIGCLALVISIRRLP